MEILARQHGVAPGQSDARVSTRARREVAKLIHRGRHHEAERVVRRMRGWLGRLARDITRKIAGTAFATPLERIARLLRQRRNDRCRDKIYALQASEVECIGKHVGPHALRGRRKVSLGTTNRPALGGQFMLGGRILPSNPLDGHALGAQIAQAERITGVPIERA